MAEFFDTGQSWTLAWPLRPQAAALVAALADPDRGWDAIVTGRVRAGLLRRLAVMGLAAARYWRLATLGSG